jgi:asparagine synthase (glutamine-hydrolysing)
MPGIVGIITKMPPARALEQLRRMLASMRHESFYVTGTWIEEKLGLYAGWVEREEACDEEALQRSETGDKALLFSGDEFSGLRIVRELRQRGHDVRNRMHGHLIHLAEEDSRFPLGLNGQFQGVIADCTRGTVTLFNDRFGMRRVYYHEAGDAFYFAAEAKALLAVKPELRAIDEQGLGELVGCGCTLEDRTIFKGVHVLPCASAWVFAHGELKQRGQYFDRGEWESQTIMDSGPYYERVRETFGRNLPLFFSSPEQVGLSLTGGLDTRMILAWQRPEPRSLPCYTFGGALQECRDVRIARRVASLCGQSHQVISVGDAFLAKFPQYAERAVFLSDGCGGVQHAADLYVNQLVRQVAPIRMSGNAGDQVLRHKTVFRPSAPLPGLFRPEFHAQVAACAGTYAHCMQGHALTVATTNQTAWYFHGLMAVELSQVTLRTPYIDNDLIEILYRGPESTLANNDLRVQLIEDGNPRLRRIRSDLGFAGTGGKLVGEASQLIHRLTMRAEYALEHGDPLWLTRLDRSLLGRALERNFVGLHKFAHFGLWYRQSLAGYIREMLLDSRSLSRPYLNGSAVEAMVTQHLSGEATCTPVIHKLLNLEYIHRLFIDAQ